MKKRKTNLPVRALVISVVVLLALLSVLGYIWRILTHSDYFKVKDVLTREVSSVDLAYLKGRNIFTLDLPRESWAIARNCPDCSRVRLARILPNRIFVEFIRRKPLAIIRLYRDFAVDENGYIFYSSLKPDEQNPADDSQNLPIISGLETKIFGPKPGNRYDNKELNIALLILKGTGRDRTFKEFKIKKINVSAIDNIIIQIPLKAKISNYSGWKAPEKNNFLEIKISADNISEKLAIMSGLINQERQNIDKIKYIDLRFKEPVIKFKDVK